MVGLRERKARVSYSNIPAGLENLSDEDEDDDVSNGNGAGPSKRRKVPEDDASMSSGDESEFELEDEQERQGRGRSRGHAGGSGSDRSEDDADEDELDSDAPSDGESLAIVEPDDDSIVDLDALGAPHSPRNKGGRGRKKKRKDMDYGPLATPTGLKGAYPKQAALPTYSNAGINLVPTAYRQLLKESAAVLAKLPVARGGGAKETYRGFGWELYPPGPPLPWVTRIRQDGEVVVDEDRGDDEDRKKRAKRVWSQTNIYTPREAFEGEAWYPEIYNPGEMDVDETPGAGPSLPRGWKWRDEVRLGLEDVGRYHVEELEVLSEAEAKEYLPNFVDKYNASGITVHLGAHGRQGPTSFYMFQSSRIENYNVDKTGYYFVPGGPVWGMDWCPYPDRLSNREQYLAITTFPSLDLHPGMSEKAPRDSKTGIQIWSVNETSDEGPGMKCEMVLCVEGGHGLAAKWMPLGAWDELDGDTQLPKLGVLAVVQLDGSVSLYSVPHPRVLQSKGINAATPDKPIFVKLPAPLLRLEVPDASCMGIDWMTGTKLVAGLSNGHLIIWDIGNALRSGSDADLLPSAYVSVTTAPIRAISLGRIPPGEDETTFDYTSEPAFIVYGGYDGSFGMLDTRDLYNPVEFSLQRVPCLTVGWAPHIASPLAFEIDYSLIMRKIRGVVTNRTHGVALHRGPGWDIGTSDYHGMIASAGSDGALLLSSVQGGFGRPRGAPLLYHRIYEVDYDKHTGEYRILDDFLPETMALDMAAGRKPAGMKTKPKPNDDSAVKSAAWPPHVAIHKAVWNNNGGIARGGWLASGMACGMGRVEFIKGRWRGGTMPPDLA